MTCLSGSCFVSLSGFWTLLTEDLLACLLSSDFVPVSPFEVTTVEQ